MTEPMKKRLSELAERLKTAVGDRLVSVILYGSAAMDDWQERSSDLNVLCVVERLGATELAQSEPAMRWWREQGSPAPLLLTHEEVRTSTDCFPMEFHDMREHRRVIYGRDVIAEIEIDQSFYRAQVEHELRAKQIRLRQKGAEALNHAGRLTELMKDSISTFSVLGRHALILAGHAPRWKKREVMEELEAAMGMRMPAVSEILAIRGSGKRLSQPEALALFDRYLGEIDAVVRFADALER